MQPEPAPVRWRTSLRSQISPVLHASTSPDSVTRRHWQIMRSEETASTVELAINTKSALALMLGLRLNLN